MRVEVARRNNLRQESHPGGKIRLSDLVEVNPAVDRSNLKPEDQVSFIPMSDVTDNGQWVGKQTRMYAEVQNGYSAFREGDVLFAKITPCTENGKGCHAVGLANGIGFGSTEFHVLRVKPGINARLIYHLSVAKEVRIHAASVMGGSAGQQRVPTDFFDLFRLPASLLDNQKQKTALFDAIDDAIEATRAVIEQTRRLKTALLQELLTNGLPGRHRKYKEVKFIGRVPDDWTIVNLSKVATSGRGTFVNGPFGSDLLTSDFVTEGVPVLYIQDIREGVFKRVTNIYVTETKAAELDFCSVFPGDVLITKVGDPPCTAAVYPDSEPSAIITQDVIRIRPDLKIVDSLFLTTVLNSWIGKAQVRRILITGTRDRVSLSDFKMTTAVLPPLEEQQEISRLMKSVDDRLSVAELHLEHLNLMKMALSQGLLTGRIPVGTTDKEVA